MENNINNTNLNQNNTDIILKTSIDLGKSEVKAFSFTDEGLIKKVINFDSIHKKNITDYTSSPNSNPNKFKVEFEGKRYEIGDSLENSNYCNQNSKTNEHHRLCLLLSIALLIEFNGQKVDVFTGLPASHISNVAERKEFINFLKGEEGKSISITVNGNPKTFIINSIIPEAEGMALFPRMKLMIDNNSKDIAVIDIGGHNFNLRKFDSYGYIIDEVGISEERVGVNRLLDEFLVSLRSNSNDRDRNLTRSDLKRFIKQQDLDPDINIVTYSGSNSDFVRDFVLNYFQTNIADRLSSHEIKLNAKGMKYLFTGGGSSLFQPYIVELYNENLDSILFSSTSKWDNCISFALNALFKISPNKAEIFKNLSKSIDTTLSNDDKTRSNPTLQGFRTSFLNNGNI